MNLSHEWLRQFVPVTLSPAELRELLTAHTATVDDLIDLRSDLESIVVARVVEARRHPDSDHLWATRVDAGGAEPLEVICGAPNVSEGKLYPFAPVGTVMPNGMKIERRKIRGIASNGMLCSARELGLGENHEGILELTVDAAPGTPLLRAMPIGDTRVVLDVGANRPDLLSHLGVAREIGAVTGSTLGLPPLTSLGAEPPAAVRVGESGTMGGIRIRVERDTKTRRYMLAIVKGIQVGPSPDWLTQRLVAVGVRSINNVVDATNYVLHELGQPIHAFDLARLRGDAVTVRMARAGEQLVTLDGAERAMPSSAVMIADGQKAQAIGGIMGGRESEVTDATRDLLIEVASFDPALTRASRKALGLTTDASYRFERGVDPELAPTAMHRVIRIITGLAGGAVAEPPIDIMSVAAEPRVIDLRLARVTQVLGESVPPEQARGYLERAGFVVEQGSGQALRVTVPSWRADVFAEIDLIEEIARFHGYDRFAVEIRPYRPTTTSDDPLWAAANRVRDAAVAMGLLEVRPMPFVSGDDVTHVHVANPLSENEAYLRNGVLESLSRRAEHNLAQRVGDIRVFEIGGAFEPASSKDERPVEQTRVGALLMGRRRPAHFTEPQPPVIDEWDAKAAAETLAVAAFPAAQVRLSPSKSGELWDIMAGDRVIGSVRRLPLDGPVWAAPAFGIELTLGTVPAAPPAAPGEHAYLTNPRLERPAAVAYRPLPTMPPAEFDLALLVPAGTSVREVEALIRRVAGELLEALDLFDEYKGEGVESGFRSLAWRLTFRHPERTLRDKEIEGRRSKILGALQQELHVRQRTT